MDNKWTNSNENAHKTGLDPDLVALDAEWRAADVTNVVRDPETGEPRLRAKDPEQLGGPAENSDAGDEDASEDEAEETRQEEETKPAEKAEPSSGEKEDPRPGGKDTNAGVEEAAATTVGEEETKPGEEGESKPDEEEPTTAAGRGSLAPDGPRAAAEFSQVVGLAPLAELGASSATTVPMPVEPTPAGAAAPPDKRGAPPVAAYVDAFYQDMSAYYRGVLAGLLVEDSIIKRVSGHFDDIYKDWHGRVFGRVADGRHARKASPITMAV